MDIKRQRVVLEIVSDISSDESVPKKRPRLVHCIKHLAGITQVADKREAFKNLSEEAVLLAEAGSEDECMDLFEVGWVRIGLEEAGEGGLWAERVTASADEIEEGCGGRGCPLNQGEWEHYCIAHLMCNIFLLLLRLTKFSD